jgi:hypothetical protein
MNLLDIVRAQIQANPARFISYGALAAVWAVTRLALLAGVTLLPDSDVSLAVATIVTFVLTEAIRRFVYSPSSVSTLTAQHEAEVAALLTPDGGAVESVDLAGVPA